MLQVRKPEKRLTHILSKHSGRDSSGSVSIRHQGGRHKRFYRIVDFKRDKIGVPSYVEAIVYDPNRNCNIALLHYKDGEKRYILAPNEIKTGDMLLSGNEAEIKPGNALMLKYIPVGTLIHNVELAPGKGARIVRAAGEAATVVAKEGNFIQVKFPSGEIRRIDDKCKATVGQVGNAEQRHQKIGTAGRARHMGKRPEVRGVAQNPHSHPHGGGEGRSGVGMVSPKSPWGKRTLGKKTRKKHKYSNKYIIKRKKR